MPARERALYLGIRESYKIEKMKIVRSIVQVLLFHKTLNVKAKLIIFINFLPIKISLS